MTIDKPAVVVTGVSTGIGEDAVRALIADGWFVFGSVRREEDAARLAERFGADFAPLLFDVTDVEAIGRAAQEVERRLEGATLAGLVNNAGVAFPGPLLHQPLDEFRRQFEINLFGQLAVIQAFAPLLGARAARREPPGRIVQMSSVAGSLASPFLGAYAASKFALEGFSDALRRELMVFGIDVIILEPGVIRTAIWDKAERADFDRYDATVYGRGARKIQAFAVEQGKNGPPPELVSNAILRALKEKRPPARIVVVARYFFDYLLPRLFPTRVLDWIIARRYGFLQPMEAHHDR